VTTYWTVIALVIGAALLVVLAFWHRMAPDGSRLPPRWVALGTSFTAKPGMRSWVGAIDVGPDTEGIDLTMAGATVSDVAAGQLGPALAARPSIAVIWLGASDLLFGTPLTTFLRDLSSVIGRLQQQGCRVLLLGLPEMMSEPSASGRRRRNPLDRAITGMRAGLRETARLTGATLVEDPAAGGPGSVTKALQVSGPVVWLDSSVLEAVGLAVSPVLVQALRDGQTGEGSIADWDEPADPVQRRRLGLPPVR